MDSDRFENDLSMPISYHAKSSKSLGFHANSNVNNSHELHDRRIDDSIATGEQ